MCKFCSVLLSQIHFDVTENTIAISFPSFVQPTSFVSHKDAIDYPFLFTCGEVCHNNNNKNKSIVFKFFRPLHYTFPIYQINSRYFFYSCSFQFPLSFIYPPPLSVTLWACSRILMNLNFSAWFLSILANKLHSLLPPSLHFEQPLSVILIFRKVCVCSIRFCELR